MTQSSVAELLDGRDTVDVFGKYSIKRVETIEPYLDAFVELILQAIEDGAVVGFLSDLKRAKAREYWRGVGRAVASGTLELFVAFLDGEPVGTVQLVPALAENQRHRADVAKCMVARRGRLMGIGRALILAAEADAAASGKKLLVAAALSGGNGARMLESARWVHAGDIPGFALRPDGTPCRESFYYKELELNPSPASLPTPTSEGP